MQPTDTTTLLEGASQLIALLERHRGTLPFADEELERHRALRHALDDQHRRGEHILSDWRAALSHRWECEISAQRVYTVALRQLNDYYHDDATYARLVAPAHPGVPTTASYLLSNMRRLEASIALLNPRPEFAERSLQQLCATSDSLAAAIDWTSRCEAERRSILLEQRIACNLYQRACDKTRRLLGSLLPGTTEALVS